MWNFDTMFIALPIMAIFVYIISKLLRMKPVLPSISSPRQSSIVAICVLAALLVIAILVILGWSWIAGKPFQSQGADKQIGPASLLVALVALLVYSLPVLLVIKWRKESLESLCITTKYFWRSTLIGLILSAVIVFSNSKNFHRLSLMETSHIIALVLIAVPAFGEEFLFRGFLQNRLIAWLGKWQGFILTTVIFSLFHTPQMFLIGMDWKQAIIKTGAYIPISLFLSFVVLRTKNLMAAGLFHTFANWINILKTIP